MTATLPKTAADFKQALNAQVIAGDTTATLDSIEDSAGVNLANGLYGFTIDGDNQYKEYIICTVTGTALTAVSSISPQGVATTGFSQYHRKGASVEITDWVVLFRILNNLTGVVGFDSGAHLGYDAAPVALAGNEFATVQYVLDHVNGGTVSYTQVVANNQTSGEALTANDHVYLKEADGKWYKVDADLTATFQQVKRGIALSTVGSNASVSIGLDGVMTGLSGLVAGTKYYASNTAGAITATPGTYTVFIGWALSATTLLLDVYGRDIPYGAQKDALAGTVGTPSSLNLFLTKYNTFVDVDQSQTTQNATLALGEANATTKKNKIAQSFIPVYPGIRGVKLYKAANTGTFSGTLSVAIQADSAGAPSGVDLATVTIANATYLLLPVGEFLAEFTSAYNSLVPGSTYWVVVTTSTADTANHPNVNYNSAGGYANGILRYNNTTDGWTTVAGADLYFKTLDTILGQAAIVDPTAGLVPVEALPAGVIDLSTTAVTLATSTAETTVYTKQIPASAFRLNSGINVKGFGLFNVSANGQSIVIRVKLNGTTVATLTVTANAAFDSVNAIYEVNILNNASLAAQKYLASLLGVATGQNTGGSSTNRMASISDYQFGTATVDTSVPVVLTITMQNSNSSASTSFTSQAQVVSKIGT